MKREFWENKKVLLTGHTGFKGAWTALWLHDMGAKVYGYSLAAPTVPSLYDKAKVRGLLTEEKIADICDYTTFAEFLKQSQPEIVLHMAAQPLVRFSYEQPILTYATNVMGTAHVMEAIRYSESVKSVVIITTDKCYENSEKSEGYREDEAMGGYDPYSSSKGCAELVVSAMRRSFFSERQIGIATARAGNVIGGGDWAQDRIIPDLVTSFADNRTPMIRNPNATRPWQHVLEPISGYLTLAESLFNNPREFSEAWNFGPYESDSKNVKYIADKISAIWGESAKWDYDKKSHPHEAKYLKLNIAKVLKRLDWKPRLDVDEALKYTCDWYRSYYLSGEKAVDLSLAQIRQFEGVKN